MAPPVEFIPDLPIQFGDNIWYIDGPTVTSFGFQYGTRMVVVRHQQDKLFIWSPIALSEPLTKAVGELGTVTAVVAPNTLHHLFVPQWQKAYPDAQVFAAPGLKTRRKDIEFDDELGDQPDPSWTDDIDQVVVRGNAITTEVVFFHKPSKTVVFTDLLQNFPPDWFSGWRKWIAKLDGMIGPQPQVPRKFRLAFTNKKAARKAVRRIGEWPAERVLMAHGTPVESNGADHIRQSFHWLEP